MLARTIFQVGRNPKAMIRSRIVLTPFTSHAKVQIIHQSVLSNNLVEYVWLIGLSAVNFPFAEGDDSKLLKADRLKLHHFCIIMKYSTV